MGYILISFSTGSLLGIYVGFYYLFIYIFISINIFTIYLMFYRHDKSLIENITDLTAILFSNFYLAIIFSLSILSLAGIPPFIGFFGKLYVFLVLIDSGNYFIAFYLILMSIVSGVYYIRMIRFILFFIEKKNDIIFNNIIELPLLSAYLIVFLIILNICLIFLQYPLCLIFQKELINQSLLNIDNIICI